VIVAKIGIGGSTTKAQLAVLADHDVSRSRTRPYRPKTNGNTERHSSHMLEDASADITAFSTFPVAHWRADGAEGFIHRLTEHVSFRGSTLDGISGSVNARGMRAMSLNSEDARVAGTTAEC